MTKAGVKHLSLSGRAVNWVILPLAALLFHVLLFSLFTPMKLQDETRTKHSRFTLMLRADPVQQESDPYELRYWMYYLDPEKMIKTDPEYGFSLIRERKRIHLPSPFHCPHRLYDQVRHFSAYPEKALLPERGLQGLTSYDTEGLIPRNRQTRNPEIAPVRYPLWVDHTGKKFSGFFLEDASSRKIFKRSVSGALRSTLLQLDLESGRIPVVTIRRSCGVPELDQLAKRQLSARKENYDFSATKERKRSFYNVLWKPESVSSSGEIKK